MYNYMRRLLFMWLWRDVPWQINGKPFRQALTLAFSVGPTRDKTLYSTRTAGQFRRFRSVERNQQPFIIITTSGFLCCTCGDNACATIIPTVIYIYMYHIWSRCVIGDVPFLDLDWRGGGMHRSTVVEEHIMDPGIMIFFFERYRDVPYIIGDSKQNKIIEMFRRRIRIFLWFHIGAV